MTLVRPKIVTSVHFCPTTQAMSFMEYRDATSLVGAPTSSVYPTKDKDNNALETEFGLSIYQVLEWKNEFEMNFVYNFEFVLTFFYNFKYSTPHLLFIQKKIKKYNTLVFT